MVEIDEKFLDFMWHRGINQFDIGGYVIRLDIIKLWMTILNITCNKKDGRK